MGETPPPPQAPILRLSESLPVPQLGSAALPSVGSASHQLGGCQPCAFLYTKGCANGVQCKFCHLCEPGEGNPRSVTWPRKHVGRMPGWLPKAAPPGREA